MESRYTTITGRYTSLLCEAEHQMRAHSPGRVLHSNHSRCAVEMVCVRCRHKHVALLDALPRGWELYFVDVHRGAGPSPFEGISLGATSESFVVLATSREDAQDLARQLEEISFPGLTTAIDVF